MPESGAGMRVPKALKARFDEITAITDRVCYEHLDEDYALLCRKAAAALSRKRPSPLLGGKANTWAAGIAYALGQVNFLSDKATQPYMRAADLAKAFGVSQATASAKATEVQRALNLRPLHPDYCLPSLIDQNPFIWMLQVDGFVVDIRDMPLSAQIVAFNRGLIPYIPALKDVPQEQMADTITSLLMEEEAIFMNEDSPSQIYQIKITLDYLEPSIWRRVEVPDNYTLGDLHYVIQIAMGWGNAHLHEFVVNRKHYTLLDDELAFESPTNDADEDSVILADVIKKKGQKFKYTYDFGDSWDHTLLVEKVLPVDADRFYPVCTGGEYACPPEDVGSIPGFIRFVDAMRNADDPEHDEYAEWYGADFDPVAFDLEAVNSRLRTTFGEESE
jgi:hypothetical protein